MKYTYLLLAFATVFLSDGCKRVSSDIEGSTSTNQPYATPPILGSMPIAGVDTLTGYVEDENNQPLPEVDVYYYGTNLKTDANGKFKLPRLNFDGSRVIIQFRKAGYFPQDAGLSLFSRTYALKVTLAKKKFVGSIQTSTGGIISFDSINPLCGLG